MEKLSSFFRPSPSLHSTSDHGINLAFLFSETVSNPPLMVALAEDPECEDPQEKVFCDLTAQRRPSGFPPICINRSSFDAETMGQVLARPQSDCKQAWPWEPLWLTG